MSNTPIKQIVITTIFAIFLNLIDFGVFVNSIKPIWILIFYSYFIINFKIKNVYFLALVLGVIIDSSSGDIIGQNALALIVSSYFICKIKNSIKIANITTISVFIAFTGAIYIVIIVAIHSITQGFDLNYDVFLPIITTALSYPIVSVIMNKFNGR